MKAKDNLTRRALRFDAVEGDNLRACAPAVGLFTMSAYMRRRCFGGRPLVPKPTRSA